MSDAPDYEHGQPPPKKNKGKSIHDLIRRDLAKIHSGAPVQQAGVQAVAGLIVERKEYGLKKYGTILQANNGRDAIQDAMEEALDLAAYLRQWLEEFSLLQDQSARDRVNAHLMNLVYREVLQGMILIQTVIAGSR